MSLTTKAAVLLTAPELAAVTDDARWNQALADADGMVSTDLFPVTAAGYNTAEQAARYLVAHILTVNNRRGAAGAVQSYRAGGVSASFAALPGTSEWSAWLGSTSYGQAVLSLTRARAAGPFVL